MLIYICSSSHGFGHAARDAAVLQQLRRLRPDWTLVMSSGLPSQVLTLFLGDPTIQQRRCVWDVGMVQADALGVNSAATLNALEQLERFAECLLQATTFYLPFTSWLAGKAISPKNSMEGALSVCFPIQKPIQ